MLGNGASIRFWTDTWSGDQPLCSTYKCLFALETSHDCNISNCLLWQGPTFTWTWQWRHPPWGRESIEFTSLMEFLKNISLSSLATHSWRWRSSIDGVYSPQEMATAINEAWCVVSSIPTFWSSLFPPKVNVFIWRLRKSFLPCYLHLAMRGIPLPSVSCPICNSTFEGANHAIMRCTMVVVVWSSISTWCRLHRLFIWKIDDLFSEEVLETVSPNTRPVLHAIFCTTTWLIWKTRNKLVKEQHRWSY